jgi:cell wall-associated NlpC family hydrolase
MYIQFILLTVFYFFTSVAFSNDLTKDQKKELSNTLKTLSANNIRYGKNFKPAGETLKVRFDCSGTVRYLYKKALDIDISPDSFSQYEAVKNSKNFKEPPIGENGKINTDALKLQLKVGDLLFWTNTHPNIPKKRKPPVSHVMVYLGFKKNGELMMGGSNTQGKGYYNQRTGGGPDVYVFDPNQVMGCAKWSKVGKKKKVCVKGMESLFIGFGKPFLALSQKTDDKEIMKEDEKTDNIQKPSQTTKSNEFTFGQKKNLVKALKQLATYKLKYANQFTIPGEKQSHTFDCSGTTQYLYKKALGITIPRDSFSQYKAVKDKGNLQELPLDENGKVDVKAIEKQLSIGDLLFWTNTYEGIPSNRVPPIGHVMIYMGKRSKSNMQMGGSNTWEAGYYNKRTGGGPDMYNFDPNAIIGCAERTEKGNKKSKCKAGMESRFIGFGKP